MAVWDPPFVIGIHMQQLTVASYCCLVSSMHIKSTRLHKPLLCHCRYTIHIKCTPVFIHRYMLIYQRGNLCWHQYNKGSLKAVLPGALFPQGM